MRKRAAFFRVTLPVLAVASLLFIFANSMQDGIRSGEKSGAIAQLVSLFLEKVFGVSVPLSVLHGAVRKLAHAAEFGAFSFWLSAAALQRRRSGEGLFYEVLTVTLFSAVTDEYLQALFAGRGPSVTDAVVDLSGALTGFGAAMLLAFFRLKKKNGP